MISADICRLAARRGDQAPPPELRQIEDARDQRDPVRLELSETNAAGEVL